MGIVASPLARKLFLPVSLIDEAMPTRSVGGNAAKSTHDAGVPGFTVPSMAFLKAVKLHGDISLVFSRYLIIASSPASRLVTPTPKGEEEKHEPVSYAVGTGWQDEQNVR